MWTLRVFFILLPHLLTLLVCQAIDKYFAPDAYAAIPYLSAIRYPVINGSVFSGLLLHVWHVLDQQDRVELFHNPTKSAKYLVLLAMLMLNALLSTIVLQYMELNKSQLHHLVLFGLTGICVSAVSAIVMFFMDQHILWRTLLIFTNCTYAIGFYSVAIAGGLKHSGAPIRVLKAVANYKH